MRKILKAGIFAVAIMSISTMTSFAYPNWQQEESGAWRCYYDDGTLTRSDWAKSGNTWYWLDENGDIAKDTIIEDDGKKYYLDASGVLAANIWVNDEGTYYYAGSDGAFLTSTTTPDGYYVDENGKWDGQEVGTTKRWNSVEEMEAELYISDEDKQKAWNNVISETKKLLKNPNTAKFPEWNDDGVSYFKVNDKISVDGWCEAKNGFGNYAEVKIHAYVYTYGLQVVEGMVILRD